MAAVTYVCQILREDGSIFLEGEIVFPDSSNAPGPPFAVAEGDDLTILESSDDVPLISGGDDFEGAELQSLDEISTVSADSNGAKLRSAGNSVVTSPSGTGVTGPVGFYGTSPVAQPAAPTDAPTIIAALQALGLVAS